MVVQAQILSAHSGEMAPSLMVATESHRFLFDVGDGIQRLCMEHKARLAKLQHVFLTKLQASTVGGLPGLILTVSDTGKKAMTIHGPTNTKKYLHATRHFLYRPDFGLEAHDIVSNANNNPVYSDAEVSIHAMPCSVSQSPSPGTKRKREENEELVSTNFISYVIETPQQRGKFLVEKAKKLGVPKGKQFGELAKGNDVILVDGTVVRSQDCLAPSIAPSGIAIIACPSPADIPNVIENERFGRYQTRTSIDAENPLQLEVVYHLGDRSVLSDPRYMTWCKRFGANVHHVALNIPECPTRSVYRSSAALQAQLHHVFPNVFPSTTSLENEIVPRSTDALRKIEIQSLGDDEKMDMVVGEGLLQYVATRTAHHGWDTTKCWDKLDFSRLEQDVAKYMTAVKDTCVETTSGMDGRLIFLGTGSAIPSKYRNVTGMYLQLGSTDSDWKGMMLDCGEGSVGQLFRYVDGDISQFNELISRLKFVWISHNHADHHLGLLRLLSLRSGQDPLILLGPTPLRYWLDEYAAIDTSIAGTYAFMDNKLFEKDNEVDERTAALDMLKEQVGIANIECVRVKHCHLSYAGVFHFIQHNFTVAFSGDCRPSSSFAQAANGSDVLIHEATFEDDMEEEAHKKMHSTTSEAIQVADEANAKHLVLTHFSQRYPKMQTINGHSRKDGLIMAMDMMSLPLNQLSQPMLAQVCTQLLAEDLEDDNKTDMS